MFLIKQLLIVEFYFEVFSALCLFYSNFEDSIILTGFEKTREQVGLFKLSLYARRVLKKQP